jgi:hypothetical protein
MHLAHHRGPESAGCEHSNESSGSKKEDNFLTSRLSACKEGFCVIELGLACKCPF